jgi:hypothetical protein
MYYYILLGASIIFISYNYFFYFNKKNKKLEEIILINNINNNNDRDKEINELKHIISMKNIEILDLYNNIYIAKKIIEKYKNS